MNFSLIFKSALTGLLEEKAILAKYRKYCHREHLEMSIKSVQPLPTWAIGDMPYFDISQRHETVAPLMARKRPRMEMQAVGKLR